jgi:uncharacterized membrane protein YjjP (DUF1212 family)
MRYGLNMLIQSRLSTPMPVRDADATTVPQASVEATLGILVQTAELLLLNGQTTQRTVTAVRELGTAFHYRTEVFPRWGQLTVRLWDRDTPRDAIAAVAPTNVDMGKVASTMHMLEGSAARGPDIGTVQALLQGIRRSRPMSALRLILMTGAGAAALGVIFGVSQPFSLTLIALSAALGAALRRGLARISISPLLPPFAAALVAGIIGALVVDLHLSSAQQLVAVCPCMVLVPGPHLLNGALDLARAEISLGVARITYASLIILMICAGLLLGLAIGGVPLPASGPTTAVPLFYDVVAAGIAVAAYGTFFSMPWRMLPIPVLIGMLAHAARWFVVTAAGLRIEMGALVACLIVGIMVTPIAERLRLPFAGIAFASVVSLIPGIFLFRMGGGLLTLTTLGAKAPAGLLQDVVGDGATAFVVVLAMAFGLIIPKLCIDRHHPAQINMKQSD